MRRVCQFRESVEDRSVMIYSFHFWLGTPFIAIGEFFFLNQQFITWCTKIDHDSHFCNYVQRKHTTRKLRKRKDKRKETRKGKGKELINYKRKRKREN